MRMNTDRRKHERVLFGEMNPGVELGRAVPVADRDHGADSRFARARDDLLAIGIELFAIEMGVRVDEHKKDSGLLFLRDFKFSETSLRFKVRDED
jgi:hypothetical protein